MMCLQAMRMTDSLARIVWGRLAGVQPHCSVKKSLGTAEMVLSGLVAGMLTEALRLAAWLQLHATFGLPRFAFSHTPKPPMDCEHHQNHGSRGKAA